MTALFTATYAEDDEEGRARAQRIAGEARKHCPDGMVTSVVDTREIGDAASALLDAWAAATPLEGVVEHMGDMGALQRNSAIGVQRLFAVGVAAHVLLVEVLEAFGNFGLDAQNALTIIQSSGVAARRRRGDLSPAIAEVRAATGGDGPDEQTQAGGEA